MTHAADAWNTPGSRAASVFGESAAAGYVLGGATAFIAVLVTGTVGPGGGTPGALLAYAFVGAGFGGGLGLVVGMLVGIVLGLLVRFGERRLGAASVAGLLPVVAMAMTVPFAVLVGSVASGTWLVSVVSLDVVLTLAGGRLIGRHYLRRCEIAHLH